MRIDGETMETVGDFIFLASKITADGDCSHEIKRHLLLGRKVMTNLDSIFKSSDVSVKQCLKTLARIRIPRALQVTNCWTTLNFYRSAMGSVNIPVDAGTAGVRTTF